MTSSSEHIQAQVESRSRVAVQWMRLVDIAVASVVLVVGLPLLALVALSVQLTSQGPALFRQERLGRGRRPFTMYKFRTMRADNDDTMHRAYVTALLTEETPPDGGVAGTYKLVDDPRITPLGAFLRRTSLDELPQLFNVLRGDMALVGPRPVLGWEAELFPASAAPRFHVRPGVTGLWQVSGRSAVGFREALDLDVEYVRTRTLGLDFKVLLRTARVLLARSTAH